MTEEYDEPDLLAINFDQDWRVSLTEDEDPPQDSQTRGRKDRLGTSAQIDWNLSIFALKPTRTRCPEELAAMGRVECCSVSLIVTSNAKI